MLLRNLLRFAALLRLICFYNDEFVFLLLEVTLKSVGVDP